MRNISAPSAGISPPDHLPHLDGLRGLAALIVVIAHSANLGFLPKLFGLGFGQMGVALFFLLSGFLMAYLYAHRPPSGANIRSYAVSRGARVLPLYYVTVAFAIITTHGMGMALLDLGGDWGIFTNLTLIYGTGLFWSIAVEVHFYGVFICLWILLHTRLGNWSFALLLGLQLVAIGLADRFSPSTFILPYWLHFFTIGCGLGVLFRRYGVALMAWQKPLWLHLLAWAMVPLGGLVLPELRRHLGQLVPHPFEDPLVIIYFTAMLIFALLALGPFAWLDRRMMRWLGAISFSSYLLHLPVLLAFYKILERDPLPQPVLVVLMFATVFLVSHLSHRLFERPAQRQALRHLQRARV